MLWRDLIYLVPLVTNKNKYGEEVPDDGPPRSIIANKKSVRQSEFYQAYAAGLRPEIVFEIRELEYANETKLLFNELTYYIVRTFSKNGEILELICSRYPMEG